MSDLRSLKEEHPLPHPGTAQASADIHQQVQDACERARDMVAQLHTTLPAAELLRALLSIEDQHGRVRQERFGPRTVVAAVSTNAIVIALRMARRRCKPGATRRCAHFRRGCSRGGYEVASAGAPRGC